MDDENSGQKWPEIPAESGWEVWHCLTHSSSVGISIVMGVALVIIHF